jgi:hypothetical protein
MRKSSRGSDVLEAAGLMAVSVSVFGLAGVWWGVLASGVAAVLYAAAIDR